MTQPDSAIKEFMLRSYRHFNARTVVEAAQAWVDELERGHKMFFSMAGAMSTAELGISLAELIRQNKIHGLCCTGANLEEDLFNLVAHDSYRRIPDWRSLTAQQELELAAQGLNRVTDTCIPEEEAMRRLGKVVHRYWQQADDAGESYLPHEFLYQVAKSGDLEAYCEIDPKDSWVLAAAERDLPLFVPGWEDSTLGNQYVAQHLLGRYRHLTTIKSGLHYMQSLVDWYRQATRDSQVGFFQIGGGIAGDFPICVVPLILQDMHQEVPMWSYFCQISDSTTSFGSYSGAVPNEKISWGKLGTTSPKFVIESDATIVAPLIFAYVLAS